jgi:hypothetical protein
LQHSTVNEGKTRIRSNARKTATFRDCAFSTARAVGWVGTSEPEARAGARADKERDRERQRDGETET